MAKHRKHIPWHRRPTRWLALLVVGVVIGLIASYVDTAAGVAPAWTETLDEP